jgi:hypothetical protein
MTPYAKAPSTSWTAVSAMPDDPLTEAEERFQALLQSPSRFSKWAARVRAEWEKSPEGKAAVAKCYRTIGGFRQGVETRRRAS